MDRFRLQTPVTLVIFNRPETTARVFERVAAASPPKLFVVADGPRANRPGEAARVAAARQVVSGVDWPCDVRVNYSDVNLGCGKRVSSGLDWVFSLVEETIVLEDDCVPHPSFFRYCSENLEHYRHERRVMHIGGSNPLGSNPRAATSVYFSRYPYVWGWASWRRAWALYDYDIAAWRDARARRRVLGTFRHRPERLYWQRVFDRLVAGEIDTWDYQWTFACALHQGVSVVPRSNLVENIGFGEAATHTQAGSSRWRMEAREADFPVVRPSVLLPDAVADECVAREQFWMPSLPRRAARRIHRYLASAIHGRPRGGVGVGR